MVVTSASVVMTEEVRRQRSRESLMMLMLTERVIQESQT